jgi:DNA-binding NarL/FixJ family response regulator
VVVDDEELVRSGIAALLHSDPDIDVVGVAENGDRAIASVGQHRPDVVLMDVRMPGRDGVSATAEITADPRLQATRVVMLTTFDLDEHVHAALQAGASGFLLKDTHPTQLLSAIHTVARGETVLAPALIRRLIATYVQRPASPATPPWLSTLTGRETQVLREVARGLNNREIGEALHVSPATAKTHVARLLAKLEARDRTHLVIAAYEAGLVDSD